MLSVSSVVVLLLCITHNDLTRSTRAEELRSIGDEASLNNVLDWKCNATSDCAVKLTSCVNGTCRCAPGYILDGSFTACIKVAQKYGDDCQESRQCSAYLSRGGTCVNGACVCADGYYYIHGQCHRYSELSGKCEDDEDCHVHGDFQAAECNNEKICDCAPKYYKREYRSCRPIAEENGGKCIINNDCKGPNATCDFVEHKCVPWGNNTASKFLRNDNTLFREHDATGQASGIGANCTKNEDCYFSNAECGPLNTCVCKRAHFFHEDKRLCVSEIGERCDPTENETVIDNSVCQNGTWHCIAETVASKDNRECEKVIARYNDNCRNDVQCYVFGPDAICKNGKCVCNEKSRLNKTESYCWMKRGIGENCHQDVDCYLDGYADVRLICDSNKLCSCPGGTYPTNDSTACVKEQAGIGDTCGVNEDCEHTMNTKCANKVCVCVDNYYVLDKQCVKGINSTCSFNDECKAKNSVCESEICTCKPDHVASSVDSCVRVSAYGEPCEEDIQCSSRIPNALCLPRTGLNSTCACPKNYHYNFGECFERKGLGMRCRNLGECYTDSKGGVVCMNDRCACDRDYIQRNRTVCELHNGGDITASTVGLVALLLLLTNLLV
ncbi:hypothetical protein QLX08_007277 [Tetragonisca angustula]|uniref:EB domain-containing protein n=1 Tax=Tetragonisca angustula TaxID=166442 RepID=A0AAW0ZQ54_9HYME